jgi:PASTA domain
MAAEAFRAVHRCASTGTPPEVAQAAARGHKIIDAAWLIFDNRAQRQRYDEQVGVVRKGEGLATPSLPRPDMTWTLGCGCWRSVCSRRPLLGDVRESLGVLADLLAASVSRLSPRRSPDLIVPDVRGMFFRVCQDAVTMAGFRNQHRSVDRKPMPVEGLVVGQSPAPGQAVPRFSALTIQVWHPPA